MTIPNRKEAYYYNDDVTFRGTFRIDGESQTPDAGSCYATVYKKGATTPLVDNAAGVISGDQLQYKMTNLQLGQYSIFLTASYQSGADQRTGIIEFVVKPKEAH